MRILKLAWGCLREPVTQVCFACHSEKRDRILQMVGTNPVVCNLRRLRVRMVHAKGSREEIKIQNQKSKNQNPQEKIKGVRNQ
ncbi:MAG: hypothetical protein WD851_13225 [Pirellulales bacterium]